MAKKIDNIKPVVEGQSSTEKKPAADGSWFFFTILFVFIEYVRPQDLFGIGFLRPAFIIVLVLFGFILKNNGIEKSKCDQIRMMWYFIFLLSLYIPFAVNNFHAYNTTVLMLKYMPVIISIIICVNSLERLKVFMRYFTGFMIYVSVYSLNHNGMGSGSFFVDENDVSLYINMILPFCYFFFLIEKNIKYKILYLSGLVFGLMAVVISFSRGGFVGLVAVFFVIWLLSPRKFLSLVLVAIIGSTIFMYSGDKYINEMSTVTNTKESTASARIKSWETAWIMFLDNPLGVGGNNFQWRFDEYQAGRFSRGMTGRVAHSLWFTLIPELGIFGIIIFYKLLRYNIRDILKIKTKGKTNDPDVKYFNAMSYSFMAAFAGYFASGTFISVLYYPHYWYFLAIIVATVRIHDNLKKSKLNTSESTLRL